MTSISHALIGAAIASRVGDPMAAGILAVITHFVCDAIPHWDLGTNWRQRPRLVTGSLAILETLVAIFGTFILFFRNVPPLLLLSTLVFSLIPDWLEVPYYLMLPNSPKIFYWIYKAQSLIHSKLQAPAGVATQIAVVTAFLIVGFVL
ncbi:MAG: hypothetical protein AAB874_03705 [Patescibacteria group bacterium]